MKILALSLMLMLFLSSSVLADDSMEVDVIVDGDEVELDEPARMEKGRTLLPARDVFEGIGAEMDWDPDTQTASGTLDDTVVEIPLGSNEATVDDEQEDLDVKAQTFEGYTYVPLRFAGKAFGGEVSWDGATNTVDITMPDKEEESKDTVTSEKDSDDELIAHFIDVGQGDAIFLEAPDKNILVDAGDNWEGETVVNYIKELDVDIIHKVVASHPHADHIGGLSEVYDKFEVEVTYDSGVEHDTETYEEYYELANEKTDLQTAKKGDTLDVESVDAQFIHPPEDHEGDIHDLNLVLNIDYEDNSILLTGDAEKPSEEMMIENSQELPSEILKVGHHGSSTSTSEEFLDNVDPEAAVIQVGEDNRYGHPDEKVLHRLQENGVDIYRNDYQGDIVVTLDDDDWDSNVKPWDGEVAEKDEPEDDEKEPIGEVNINTASKEELQEITHISETRAEEIKESRPFDSLDQLTQIHGIADQRLEDIKEEGTAYVE
ncbi:stalk domain-containing protein [Natranaerobius trueperi]|uniref:Metallo-beta-lactamase domain-containing protein n=1 Tax=Natranaerobius trueperi TaxID=759412 RepID=A0A226BYW2_9FIRM|nr:stalk domain-containing protein [Natranaerobius trueperi]OWZ84115.1 hypothetical protein CDO51_05210 [Natranaerobius trueperi]